jgi:hypothetical protein
VRFKHHRAGHPAVVDDGGLDLIADGRELHRAALRVAELGGIDDRFAFAADLDERTAGAERNRAPAYHLPRRELLRSLRFAGGQQRGEVLIVATVAAIIGWLPHRTLSSPI